MTEELKEKDIEKEEEQEEIVTGSLSNDNLDRVNRGEDIILEDDKEDELTEEKADKAAKAKEEEELEPDKDGNITISKENLDKLKKRVVDKEDHIKKIEEDNFNLREKKRAKVAELETQVKTLEEKLETASTTGDTKGTVEAMKEVDGVKEKLTEARQEEISAGNKVIIDKHTPDIQEIMPDIIELLKSDEAEEEVIEQFKNSPYLFDPGVVVNLAKRVAISKDLIKANDRIAVLEKEVAEAEKKPGSILKKIEEQTNKGTKMTGKSGGVVDESEDKGESIYSMSSEQLKKIERGK